MYSYNQNQGFPITVSFFTKQRSLFQEKFNSKIKFSEVFQSLSKNAEYKSQVKPKSKYLLNGKEIRKNQSLEEILLQSMNDPSTSELLIELEDLLYSGDAYSPLYKKILQPKLNPFGLYIYNPKEASLCLKDFEEKIINLFELNKINEGSAYCNSNEDLYISGCNEANNKDFWIINNNDFSIKKKNMPFSKQNHSMIYLNFKENEQWIFIVGGNDKKSFYYDLNKNYFINWGDTNELYQNPALIQIGEYLYIFDTINTKRNYFERTKIINPLRKWEKIVPTMDKKLIKNFPNNFSLSYDINGNILLLGGNNITSSNNTYIYEPNKNTISLSQRGTNDNMIFEDKSFYKINNKYSVALPKNLTEKKEILVVDKNEQSLFKINVDIPKDKNNKVKIKSKIIFDDKKIINTNTEAEISIKSQEIKGQNKNKYQNRTQYNNQINHYQHQQNQQFICNDCIINNDLVCQCCHKNFSKYNNNTNSQYQHQSNNINKNITRQNPYIESTLDKYYPTLDKRYAQNKYQSRGYPQNKNVKVEIIYDEYTPIKVDYELGKPYIFKFKKNQKKDEKVEIKQEIKEVNKEVMSVENKVEIRKIEEQPQIINDDINNANNIIGNDINVNLVKGLEDNNEQNFVPENQDNDSLFVKSQNLENIQIVENNGQQNNLEEKNEEPEQEYESEFIEESKNKEANTLKSQEKEQQEEHLEPYINEEENNEQENDENMEEQHQYEENNEIINENENGEEGQYEEHYENEIEEKNEEYNEQIEEEHEQNNINMDNNNLIQSQEKEKEHEVMRDSLEMINKELIINENKNSFEVKNQMINREEDTNIIRPMLKLDFGFKNELNCERKAQSEFMFCKGLKLDLEEDKVTNCLLSKESLRIEYYASIEKPKLQIKEKEEAKEIKEENLEKEENQENHENIINEEENQNQEQNQLNENSVEYIENDINDNNNIEDNYEEEGGEEHFEEMNYEYEGEEGGEGDEMHYGHGEEINFEEGEEEMHYEEENVDENEHENDNYEEPNEANEYEYEQENEEEHHFEEEENNGEDNNGEENNEENK